MLTIPEVVSALAVSVSAVNPTVASHVASVPNVTFRESAVVVTLVETGTMVVVAPRSPTEAAARAENLIEAIGLPSARSTDELGIQDHAHIAPAYTDCSFLYGTDHRRGRHHDSLSYTDVRTMDSSSCGS